MWNTTFDATFQDVKSWSTDKRTSFSVRTSLPVYNKETKSNTWKGLYIQVDYPTEAFNNINSGKGLKKGDVVIITANVSRLDVYTNKSGESVPQFGVWAYSVQKPKTDFVSDTDDPFTPDSNEVAVMDDFD